MQQVPREVFQMEGLWTHPAQVRCSSSFVSIWKLISVLTASAAISRSSSSATRNNDRLQERLARAMAKKKSEGRPGSPASTEDPISRTATPVNEPIADPAPETLAAAVGSSDLGPIAAIEVTAAPTERIEDVADESHKDGAGLLGMQADNLSDSQGATSSRPSVDDETQIQPPELVINGVKAPQVYASPEEMFAYIEKIDALQAKLQYLTKEAAASAHDASAAAKAGSVEKKMLEKDEKIALLMSEGEKLSKTEMKQSMVIKKLRAQAVDQAKSQSSVKARADKAEANLSSSEQRLKRAEAAKRSAEENLEASLRADRDVEALTGERDALKATIAEIRTELGNAVKRVESAESKAQSDALAKQRKDILELNDDLASAKIEREISEDKLRREIRDLKASLDREKDYSKSLESELRAEQSLLESKMETLRTRAEEASSSSAGDVQAKLLRQLETLQSQYSVASENWQGIEGSLLSRLANVEKERDELESREGDLRKKVRELTLKARNAERALEDSRDAVRVLDQTSAEHNTEIQRLQRESKAANNLVAEARAELENLRLHSEAELSRRMEEEKSRWKESFLAESPMLSRTESPMGSLRGKGSGLKMGSEHLGGISPLDRNQSLRSSVLPSTGTATYSFRISNTPPRQNSINSVPQSANGPVPETPTSHVLEVDEYFPEPPTPISLGTPRGVTELMSVSTVGAGPSVQLVERMSASVRRLESEKVAHKDELVRLTNQRDGARKEVVALMSEIEQKRAIDEKLVALEEELRQVNERHQTTLEMLGEKSELVEELRADVADVKQMYRDLVDTTMK